MTREERDQLEREELEEWNRHLEEAYYKAAENAYYEEMMAAFEPGRSIWNPAPIDPSNLPF